jgi:hypothetical protein
MWNSAVVGTRLPRPWPVGVGRLRRSLQAIEGLLRTLAAEVGPKGVPVCWLRSAGSPGTFQDVLADDLRQSHQRMAVHRRDGGFAHAAESLREADPGIVVVYEVTPKTFDNGRTHSQTGFRFSRE